MKTRVEITGIDTSGLPTLTHEESMELLEKAQSQALLLFFVQLVFPVLYQARLSLFVRKSVLARVQFFKSFNDALVVKFFQRSLPYLYIFGTFAFFMVLYAGNGSVKRV